MLKSVEKLADDLHRYRSGEPILARPVGVLERARKWVRRHPAVTALTLTTLLTVLVGFALVTWKWFEADAAQARTAQAALVAEEEQRREAEQRRAGEEKQRCVEARATPGRGGEAARRLPTHPQAEAEEEASRVFHQAVYDSAVDRIGDEWSRGNLHQVEQLLTQCPQGLRGWEWDYWQRRLRGTPPHFPGRPRRCQQPGDQPQMAASWSRRKGGETAETQSKRPDARLGSGDQ